MIISPKFLRSVLLASCFSFVAPILLMGGMLASLFLASYVPGLDIIGQSGAESIWKFLAIFGNGSPTEGIFTIGWTCALVGALFDTYAFYRY